MAYDHDAVIYSPGQANVLFKFWPEKPVNWFIIGGPANANEAQVVVSQHPEVKCLGAEPSPQMHAEQTALRFPGQLLTCALWSSDQPEFKFRTPLVGDGAGNGRHIGSSAVREFDRYIEYVVPAKTLDTLSTEYGPFTNVVLWMDIEEAEYEALLGAVKLFEARQILLVNVEAFDPFRERICKFLNKYGLEQVDTWGGGMSGKISWANYVFKLKD